MKNFNRLPILDNNYLENVITYIHANPVEANLCQKAENWPYSSMQWFSPSGLRDLTENIREMNIMFNARHSRIKKFTNSADY
jgi:hypothetical protein